MSVETYPAPSQTALIPLPQIDQARFETSAEVGRIDGQSPGILHFTASQDERLVARYRSFFPDGLGRDLAIEVRDVGEQYPQLGQNESYRLEFFSESIHLEAPSVWGALHGLTTLWQLHQEAALPTMGSIDDHPRFPWRGVLLDVARHYLPIALLYRITDGLARLKLNVLHLHLTDDQAFRFRSRTYPELASEESYTEEELSELVAYAARLGVRVIPELDVPGHVHSWLVSYPAWGAHSHLLNRLEPTDRFGVHKACLNVGNEAVYDALETLFTEVIEIFPDRFIHIGGDEVHPAWWSQDPAVQAYMEDHEIDDVQGLQTAFNQRMCSMLKALGREVVAWDEVLHEDMPDLLVQNWRGATTRDRALAAKQNCLVSAGYYLDLFYPAEMHYQYDPEATQQELVALEDRQRQDLRLAHVADGITWTDQWRRGAIELSGQSAMDSKVLGGEACLWSELVDEQTIEVRLWSRLPAVAERLWSARSVTDLDHFYRRLDRFFQFDHFGIAEIQTQRLAQLGLQPAQINAVSYLEPVKWYARLLGDAALQARLQGSEMPQARPYNVHSPLNRIVDFIAPESLSARALIDLDSAQMKGVCRAWCGQVDQAWPEDVRAAMSALARVGQLLLDHISAAERGVEQDISTLRAQLLSAYTPCGEYMLAVVPWMLKWLEQT